MDYTNKRGKAYLRDKEQTKFASRLKKHLYYAWLNDENGRPIPTSNRPKITWRDLIGQHFFKLLRKTRTVASDSYEKYERKQENKRERINVRKELKNSLTNDV